MDYTVEYSQGAANQLVELYTYILQDSSAKTAQRYIDNLVEYCDSLALFPHRGNCRDDILPGLRITHYRKRTIIAFVIREKAVTVTGIWYGGRDHEAHLLTE